MRETHNEILAEAEHQEGSANSFFDIGRLLQIIQSRWYIFLFSVVLAICVSKVVIRYLTPTYHINSKILIKVDNQATQDADEEVAQLLNTGANPNSADNEVEILKTATLAEEVVRSMQLNIKYYLSARFKPTELYNSTQPFKLVFTKFNEDSIAQPQKFQITCKGQNRFYLTTGNKTWTGNWGDMVKLPIGDAVLIRNYECPIHPKNIYTIVVTNYQSTIDYYLKNLDPEIPNKQVTTIALTLKENIPQKGVDVLDKFMQTYIQDKIDDQNATADSTIEFISERLATVSEQLRNKEGEIEVFKKENGLVDPDVQGTLLVKDVDEKTKKLNDAEVQLNLTNSIEAFVREHTNSVVPSGFLSHENLT